MNVETIERTFTPKDWKESFCDLCNERMDVVLLADERVCYQCLVCDFDEAGDKVVKDSDLVFGNDYRQKIANAAIVLLLSGFFAGLVFGALLFEAEEISRFMREVL
jgi:hypothetical protein